VAGRDITEGDGNEWALAPDSLPIARGIADVGIVSTDAIWQNTNISYDFAIGGMPFISAVTDKNEYLRETAPFKKDQFDNGQEPGEQSLTGWWLRSQMSFHGGAGINFYDPLTNDESGHYRFNDSQGVDVWTKGEVKLLKEVNENHITTAAVTGTDHQHANQHVRSIQYNGTNAVLLHDGYDVDKIVPGQDPVHFIDYISGSAEPVYAICDDGVYAYWVTNADISGTPRLHMYKKLLTDNTTTIPSPMFTANSITITHATMEFIKDRIILCVNNVVYELATNATSLPSAVYTNTNTNYHYTSVAASGPAIYTAGHSGIYSTIQKYTLTTSGGMPVLTAAVVAAELPAGEIVEKIYYYLGYMCIGTNKGIRVALVNDQDGSLDYGPLIVETEQPVYDFAGRDRFVWAASGIGALDAGLIRIDLENEISTLRMAYANDLQVTQTTEHYTTGVAFIGTTNRLAFCTAHNTTNGAIYTESASTLRESGYITTGNIRFGTLEPKNFKRLVGRGNFDKGMLTLATVDNSVTPPVEYDHITYDAAVQSVEVGTNQPTTAKEYIAYKFTFLRDATTTSAGPIFKGYQAKATIATPRQRIIQFPVYCFDVETDRNGVQVGYEDRAQDRILQLEALEEPGDILLWQDLNTKELRQVQIEKVRFTKTTPPSTNFKGSGGIIEIVVRTV
jgi:hypothetical protein